MNSIRFYSFLFLLLFISCVAKKNTVPTKVIYITSQNPKVATVTPSYLSAKLKEFSVLSDFFPAKGQNERVRFLILHYTACEMKTAVKLLTTTEVSSHYLISDSTDNKIQLLVTEDKRAWHAGISSFKGFSNLNDTSIGIEIVNEGYKKDSLDSLAFIPFTDYQIEKVASLAKDIVERYKIEPTFLLGHSDIAPQRKYDPGPLFPWKKLYDDYAIGAWYEEETKNAFYAQFNESNYELPEFITATQKDLAKYGYEIAVTGVWDEQTKRVIRAFQYHFRPLNVLGILDQETWAIIQALNDKYRK